MGMTIGEHMMLLRKKKGLSQAELGKRIGTSGDIIGRYERDIMMPSIEVIMKIADVLEVSIDFLVGSTSLKLDKPTLKRLEDIQKLSEENQKQLFMVIDALIRDFKNKKAYSK